MVRFSGVSQRSSLLPESNCAHTEYTPHCQLRLQAQTFQTPALAAFDIEVDANSCFPELLLAVATVDVACRYCTLATGADNGVYITASHITPWLFRSPYVSSFSTPLILARSVTFCAAARFLQPIR